MNITAQRMPFLVLSLLCLYYGTAQDLNMRYYHFTTPSPFIGTGVLDVTVLDDVFDTVTVNGTVRTADTSNFLESTTLPTNVSGFSGIDMVVIGNIFFAPSVSVAQADALVEYVKQGGMLFGGFEQVFVSDGTNLTKYVAERLYCPSEGVTITANSIAAGLNPAIGYHPNNGALLLTGGGATLGTTTTFDSYTGVPSESAILLGETFKSCNNTNVLEFIAPAYPKNSACGVNGFAILGGEGFGPLEAGYNTIISDPFNNIRNNTVLNQNYAQLAYDFLYDTAALNNRLAWASDPANNNATCPPATLPCAITDPGTIAGTCTGSNNLEFTMNVTGSGTASTYTVTFGATTLSSAVAYGSATTFSIPSGADDTDKTITITDDTDTSCTINVTITGAEACACDSGANAPKFLTLSSKTWLIMGVTLVIAGGVFLSRKKIF